MQETNYKSELDESVLSLLWSLWTELGVSGWGRKHVSHAIDIESLIIFTASFREIDRRLRDEVTDWCVEFGRYVSATRLRTLLDDSWREFVALRSMYGGFAATVNRHGNLNWPHATEVYQFQPTDRSYMPEFARSSLIQLRLRSVFGVSTRAEVVRVFLADPFASLPAADIAETAGYSKRNVSDALESLRVGGILDVVPVRNTKQYRVMSPETFIGSLGTVPDFFPSWIHIFRVLSFMKRYAEVSEQFDAMGASVAAAMDLRAAQNDIRLAGWRVPEILGLGDALASQFEKWSIELVKGIADADENVFAPSRSRTMIMNTGKDTELSRRP
ncbi:MAG: hypothetical protein ACYDCC_10810 [Actinomycetota bacterium]